MLSKLTKHQQQKVEEAWVHLKPQLIMVIEENYGLLKMLLVKAERDAEKNLGSGASITWLKEEKRRRKQIATKAFFEGQGFFKNANKGIQNKALLAKAERLISAKSVHIERRLKDTGFDPRSFPSNGHEFEHWVASSLEAFGWSVEVTSGSGDQGADILASTEKFMLAIQCKRYAGSVGNRAVQEAHSGAVFYEANAAAVITTGRFTNSARNLAKRTGVYLCSVDEIPDLIARFKQQWPQVVPMTEKR